MRSKDEVCDVKYVCDESIQDEFMSGMKFGWNIRWDEISRETVKWNQKMKSVMQTANEMETEMVKLLCKYMESVMRTADEMRTEIVPSAKNTSVMALSQG